MTRIENADVERVTGIEPAWPAWKAGALPLSYTRVSQGDRKTILDHAISVLGWKNRSSIRSAERRSSYS